MRENTGVKGLGVRRVFTSNVKTSIQSRERVAYPSRPGQDNRRARLTAKTGEAGVRKSRPPKGHARFYI